MTGAAGAAGEAALQAAVRETLGLDLAQYRGRQMERRLAFFRQRHGLNSNAEVAARLRQDPQFCRQFADFITINVSEFFRNPDRFAELRERHLPALLRRRKALRVWSAGCSIGAEIYTVALLLAELAPGQRHDLLATDIDAASLARAKAGIYQPQEIRAVPPAVQQRWFRQTEQGWEVAASLRAQVRIQRHDLLASPFPADLDLILCRNVVIYFTDAAKAELYRKFHASLRAGGVLFVGATESIFEARAIGLRYISPCFYVKPDDDGARPAAAGGTDARRDQP